MAKRQKKQPTPGDVMVLIGLAALMGSAIREQMGCAAVLARFCRPI